MLSYKQIIFTIILISVTILPSASITYIKYGGTGTGTSWEDALPADSLQWALWNTTNTQIWIGKGVYRPIWQNTSSTDPRRKHFRVGGRRVYGGFEGWETDISERDLKNNETILCGDIGVEGDDSDNCYHVMWVFTSTIDGITIQNGNANGMNTEWSMNNNSMGGAVLIIDHTVTFRNCTFRNNKASMYGGAVANYWNDRFQFKIENCLFYENEAGQQGGAVFSWGKSTVMTNNTIVNNRAQIGGGVFIDHRSSGGPIELINNIVWGNAGEDQIGGNYYSYQNTVSHNAVQGGYRGFENIDLFHLNEGKDNSPYFTDPLGNDWTLQPQSPCIDSGVYWNALDVDIVNNNRSIGECVDIGAYEHPSDALIGVPPLIETLSAEFTTVRSARVRGRVFSDGATTLITKGVIYNDTPGFDPETEGKMLEYNEIYEAGEFYFDITALQPNTTYYYRAYCENRAGSALGGEKSFTTRAEINPDVNGIVYVKTDGTGDGSSWENALHGNDLQYGIDHPDTKEVWVAQGIYKPSNWPSLTIKAEIPENDFVYMFYDKNSVETKFNGTSDRERHFSLRPGKAVYGGFNGMETSRDQRDFRNNETILSGDIGAEGYPYDNVYHVIYHYFHMTVDPTAVLDGFTIRDGHADGSIYGDSFFGGGMFNRTSSPTIRNCVFENNYGLWGGAIINGHAENYDPSKPVIYNTLISNNTAEYYGGGIYNIAGYPVLTNCAITNNHAKYSGGGIYHWANRSTFKFADDLNIRHCTIAGNTSPAGAQISFCTDFHNPTNLYNSIVWGDRHPVFSWHWRFGSLGGLLDGNKESTLNSYYSAFTSGYKMSFGEGNIELSLNNAGDSLSPYFTDHISGDYSLMPGSPCINKAIYRYKTNEDILGTPRPQGEAYDMGAYELLSDEPNAVPPTVITSFADNITASSASCHGDVTDGGGSSIVRRGISAGGKLYAFSGEFDEGLYSTLVSGLSSGTSYNYRAYAENRIGQTYGEQEAFTTIGLSPDTDGIFYVKEYGTGSGSSWENALNGNDIQMAIDHEATKQVWVAKGTYYPTSWPKWGSNDREKHFSLKGGVKLKGGFEGNESGINDRNFKLNETILSGDLGVKGDNSDNAYNIIYNYSNFFYDENYIRIYDIDTTAVIDGFTVRDGFNEIPARAWIYLGNGQGAGMYNYYASPIVRNCRFINNHAQSDGGAVYVFAPDKGKDQSDALKFIFENCEFADNSSDERGGAYRTDMGVYEQRFISCSFKNNTSLHGSAMLLGIYNGDVTIANSLFDGNTASDLGTVSYLVSHTSVPPDFKVINSTFAKNAARLGSALYIGIGEHEFNTILTNSVFYGNSPQQISFYTGVGMYYTSVINNCAFDFELDFEHTGSNNITLSPNNAGDPNSPYFSDPDRNHWWIQEASPLRNAGIWTTDVPLYDIAGFPRGEFPSIGCYEYDPSSIEEGESLVPMTTKLYQNYPNPFNPATNIKFSIAKAGKVELTVYNVLGQVVTKLVEKELKAGHHSIVFNADAINSGIYYYTLEADGRSLTKRMLMIK